MLHLTQRGFTAHCIIRAERTVSLFNWQKKSSSQDRVKSILHLQGATILLSFCIKRRDKKNAGSLFGTTETSSRRRQEDTLTMNHPTLTTGSQAAEGWKCPPAMKLPNRLPFKGGSGTQPNTWRKNHSDGNKFCKVVVYYLNVTYFVMISELKPVVEQKKNLHSKEKRWKYHKALINEVISLEHWVIIGIWNHLQNHSLICKN